MVYDYREAMKVDILNAIKEREAWTCKTVKEDFKDIDEAFERLYDDLWVDDSVTGNASGSYTFNTYKAEENLCHNWDLIEEAMWEFAYCTIEGKNVSLALNPFEKGAEWCDCIIRCYLLAEVLRDVLEKIFEEV